MAIDTGFLIWQKLHSSICAPPTLWGWKGCFVAVHDDKRHTKRAEMLNVAVYKEVEFSAKIIHVILNINFAKK